MASEAERPVRSDLGAFHECPGSQRATVQRPFFGAGLRGASARPAGFLSTTATVFPGAAGFFPVVTTTVRAGSGRFTS